MDPTQENAMSVGVYRYGGGGMNELTIKVSWRDSELLRNPSLSTANVDYYHPTSGRFASSFTENQTSIRWQEKIYSILEIEQYSTNPPLAASGSDFIHEKYIRETSAQRQKIFADGGIAERFRVWTIPEFDPRMDVILQYFKGFPKITGKGHPKDNAFRRRMIIMLESLRQPEAGTLPELGSVATQLESQPLCLVEIDTRKKLIIFRPDLYRVSDSLQEPCRVKFTRAMCKCVEYRIECVGNPLEPAVKSKSRARTNILDKVRRILKDPYFLTMRPHLIPLLPSNEEVLMLFRIQICSLSEFTGSNCYLEYCVILPDSRWSPSTDESADQNFRPGSNISYGRSQKCFPNGEGWCHFSLPIEVQANLKLSSDESKTDQDTEPSKIKWPMLYLHVISIDWWGAERSEGFAHIPLPRDPGHALQVCRTTKLSPTRLRSRLEEYFLGGLTSAPIGLQQQQSSPSSSSILWDVSGGFELEKSVNVHLTLDTVMQCNQLLEREAAFDAADRRGSDGEVSGLQFRRGSTDLDVSASIWDVLQAFESARQKMILVRDQVLEYLATSQSVKSKLL